MRQVADGDRLLTLGDHQGAIDAYFLAGGRPGAWLRRGLRPAGRGIRPPGQPRARPGLRLQHHHPGGQARSIADLERAFRLGADNDVLALATQGANYFFAQRYGDAEALARRALDRNPA